MLDGCGSVYLRKVFAVENPAAIARLELGILYDDGAVDIADPLRVLFHLFLGESIPAPFPDTGRDPSPDSLRCWADLRNADPVDDDRPDLLDYGMVPGVMLGSPSRHFLTAWLLARLDRKTFDVITFSAGCPCSRESLRFQRRLAARRLLLRRLSSDDGDVARLQSGRRSHDQGRVEVRQLPRRGGAR